MGDAHSSQSLRVIGLCAGIGGLELGVSQVEDCYPVCFVEKNPLGQKILAHHWPKAQQISDIFDDRCLEVEADILMAGFPCQPWSLAGKQRGVLDERWIFPRIGEIICKIRPRFVFLENVPAIVSGGGIGPVLGTLAKMGYDAAWGMFSCKSLGASHKRDRIFIFGRDRELAHPSGNSKTGQSEQGRRPFSSESADAGTRPGLAWPPGRDRTKWRFVPQRLFPSELSFCRVANGFPKELQQPVYTHRMVALGNAVSPPVAAVAWRFLKQRIEAATN